LTGTASEFAGLPGKKAASLPGAPEVRVNFWAWNSQMGCLYANGGSVTTENSLMAKQGVKMTITRQDDTKQMQAELMALAKAMHDGEADPKNGVHFIGIMGDQSGDFFSQLNEQLEDSFGPEYKAEIVFSCGYSRGEDALWGPKEWRENPQTMRGAVIATPVREGDWNIVVRFAADNNIPINPSDKTYDPGAVNFVFSPNNVAAGTQFVAKHCEPRIEFVDGKKTGKTVEACVNGAAVWTPVDKTIVKERGGVVRVISTAPDEYGNQMPHVLIGIRKYNQTHNTVVEKVITAFAQGGNQVLSFPKALDRAAEISQEINKESGWTAADWKKYYLGTTEKDKQGQTVTVGGSKANNLADNAVLFGIADGMSPPTSRFHATYTVFGQTAHKLYPDLVREPAPMDSVVDLSYLRVVLAREGEKGGKAEIKTYSTTDTISRKIGQRSVSITFATGSAELAPAGRQQLNKLFDELSLNELLVEVQGHTDNVGNSESNRALSETRAEAIKAYLEARDQTAFPLGRVKTHGFGDSKPIADNATPAGRAKNRRVEIIIGQ
jgi:OOP family OmpA-OmpF porin